MSCENEILKEILKKLDSINTRLYVIEENLSLLKRDSYKMNEHIDFVENVYDVVKKPFRQALSFYYGKEELKEIGEEKLDMLN